METFYTSNKAAFCRPFTILKSLILGLAGAVVLSISLTITATPAHSQTIDLGGDSVEAAYGELDGVLILDPPIEDDITDGVLRCAVVALALAEAGLSDGACSQSLWERLGIGIERIRQRNVDSDSIILEVTICVERNARGDCIRQERIRYHYDRVPCPGSGQGECLKVIRVTRERSLWWWEEIDTGLTGSIIRHFGENGWECRQIIAPAGTTTVCVNSETGVKCIGDHDSLECFADPDRPIPPRPMDGLPDIRVDGRSAHTKRNR